MENFVRKMYQNLQRSHAFDHDRINRMGTVIMFIDATQESSSISFYLRNNYNVLYIIVFSIRQKKRNGAEEAHWAHNPRVGGSKLPSATLLT